MEHLPAQTRGIFEGDPHDRVPGLGHGLDPQAGRSGHHEQPVVAVHVGRSEVLALHRKDASPLLAGGFRDELLDPIAEAGDVRRQHQGELVHPGQSRLPHGRPQGQPGIVLGRDGRAARRSHCHGPLQQGVQIDPHQRCVHQAEVRQRRVAPADVGIRLEHLAEPPLPARVAERGSRVGDRDEVRAVGDLLPEVRQMRQRLGGGPGLAGDHEQGLREVQRPLDRKDLVGVRGVQYHQIQGAGSHAEGLPEHLRGQAGAAHPGQHGGSQAVVGTLPGEGAELAQVCAHVRGHGEPAQPVGDLGGFRAPHGRVVVPDPPADPLLLERGEPVLHGSLEPRFGHASISSSTPISVSSDDRSCSYRRSPS